MPIRWNDTDPKVEEIQIALLRKAGIAQRTMRTRSLSRTVVNLSRRAIARTLGDVGQKERDLVFVRIHYGDDLARRLEAYLDNKQP